MLRLLNGALYRRGGSIVSDFSGRGDCSDIVIKGKKTGEPQLVLPCYGDRIFAQTQDDEMAFSIPGARFRYTRSARGFAPVVKG